MLFLAQHSRKGLFSGVFDSVKTNISTTCVGSQGSFISCFRECYVSTQRQSREHLTKPEVEEFVDLRPIWLESPLGT